MLLFEVFCFPDLTTIVISCVYSKDLRFTLWAFYLNLWALFLPVLHKIIHTFKFFATILEPALDLHTTNSPVLLSVFIGIRLWAHITVEFKLVESLLYKAIDRFCCVPWGPTIRARLIFRKPLLEAPGATQLVTVIALDRVINYTKADYARKTGIHRLRCALLGLYLSSCSLIAIFGCSGSFQFVDV